MSDAHLPTDQSEAESNPYASPRSLSPGASASASAAQHRSPLQWRAHVRQRIRRYESPRAVRDATVAEGLAPADADRYVADEVRAFRRGAGILIVAGVVMVLLGCAAAVALFAAETRPPREALDVGFSPAPCGLLVALFGLVRWLRSAGLGSEPGP